ncbi:hypothetical protein FHW69_002745 [Luteibacter sp. Sphag1AF]|uniref:hypothetical protein n=1 Tax=Luteibacter sp. Sphag1AF TaxID=2587031 RepID=UPI00161803C3|nr:hypothetical protein [Luteibacter sp. Sphag1AF]MBB3228110.1 hypothetical protein [Luteibacter sp. Sphag1AF]
MANEKEEVQPRITVPETLKPGEVVTLRGFEVSPERQWQFMSLVQFIPFAGEPTLPRSYDFLANRTSEGANLVTFTVPEEVQAGYYYLQTRNRCDDRISIGLAFVVS